VPHLLIALRSRDSLRSVLSSLSTATQKSDCSSCCARMFRCSQVRCAKLEREAIAHQYRDSSHHFERNGELRSCDGFAQRITKVVDVELAGTVRVTCFGDLVYLAERLRNLKSHLLMAKNIKDTHRHGTSTYETSDLESSVGKFATRSCTECGPLRFVATSVRWDTPGRVVLE
jgi:hypothetical protein